MYADEGNFFVCIPWLQAYKRRFRQRKAGKRKRARGGLAYPGCKQTNGGLDSAKRTKENVPGGLVCQDKQVQISTNKYKQTPQKSFVLHVLRCLNLRLLAAMVYALLHN